MTEGRRARSQGTVKLAVDWVALTGAGRVVCGGSWFNFARFVRSASRLAYDPGNRSDAPPLEQARTRFNDYGPLLRLERFGEARALLHDCRIVFERENAMRELGGVFSALANLEDATARPAAAQRFEEAALRYSYAAVDSRDMAISHFNLAHYIGKAQGPPRAALAHRLAAVLLEAVMGSGRLELMLRVLAGDLADFGPPAHTYLPADFAVLCTTVAEVKGVRFGEVFDHLAAGCVTGDALLQTFLAQASDLVRQSAKRSKLLPSEPDPQPGRWWPWRRRRRSEP